MQCAVAQSLLAERVLDDPDLIERTDEGELDGHVHECATCRAERDALERLLGEMAAVMLPPEPAPAAVRERLLFGTRAGRPLPSFAAGLARLYDLPVAEARRLLIEMSEDKGWGPGLVAGNKARQIAVGPGAGEGAQGWLLCTEPGVTLWHHRHVGAETTFVMQGGYRCSLGDEVWAGETVTQPAGSEHDLLVLPPSPCIAAVLVHGGIIPVAR
jgi:anti-sigma factor ChrR (cupin superfamily)